MRLPPPARAATGAGILLAIAVLLLATDLAVVQAAGDEAQAVPFHVEGEGFTAVGMRITNAGGGDLVRAYEMLGNAACGLAYRSPLLVPYTPSNDSANGTRVYFVGDNGTAWTYGNLTFPRNAQVAGNVTFHVVESVHTPDVLRGDDVPTYRTSRREADIPSIHIRDSTGVTTGEAVARIVRVSVHCQGDALVRIERGPHPGVNVRQAFDPEDPWLDDLPVNQGIDLLYVVRADEQKDNETYALLADAMRGGAEFWTYSMDRATVFDDRAIVPDLVLRSVMAVTLACAVVLLALALRRAPPAALPGRTDAALAVAAAGEGHLRRLRGTWGLVGALLVPLLAAATYLVFAMVPFTGPSEGWVRFTGVVVLALDAAVLPLWALAFLRAHRDLAAWRAAWIRLDRTDLDSL